VGEERPRRGRGRATWAGKTRRHRIEAVGAEEATPVLREYLRTIPILKQFFFYVVLKGRGVLEIERETVEFKEGKAVFVPAGAEHPSSATSNSACW